MNRNTDSPIIGLTEDMNNVEIDSFYAHGDNDNFAKADKGTRTQCMLCFTSKLSLVGKQAFVIEKTPLNIYQFLHKECPTCRPSDDSETQLCGFCRHIRLRHILSCLPESRWNFDKKYIYLEIEVDFGSLEEIRTRQNCGLCRLIADTVSIHAQEAPEGNRSSIPNFAKLNIILQELYHPTLNIRSNLLKKAVSIVAENLRPLAYAKDWLTEQGIWRAPSGEEIPWDRIRESLPNIEPSPIGRLPSNFRLIDVLQRRCVAVGPSFSGSFAALSYVWGSAVGVGQAKSAADLHNLPHTIEDALHACRQLGQKYLWVDQICIKQDDLTDKANQIASMAAIYSSASFVIVAAAGESAHSGISGMHLARGKLQARASFLDFELSSSPNFDRDISSSIWSTRGWTFQEAVLTKIRLYFSCTGVWLNFEEDGRVVRYSCDFDRTSNILRERLSAFFEFANHLQTYTSRKLTYDYDIYNAFSGIMTVLFGSSGTDVYGLPEQHFNQALLWAPSRGGPPPSIRAFRNDPDQDPAVNPLLPTWSWASVRGGVKIPESASRGQMVSLVKWARISPSSQPPTPTLIDEEGLEPFEWVIKKAGLIGPRFFLAILWSYSAFDSPSPFAPLQPNDTTQTSGKELKQRWPSLRDFWREVRSGGSRSPTYPGLDIPGLTGQDDFKLAQLKPGVLLTRAQSAHVCVDPSGYLRDSEHGALIGMLYGGDRGLILRGDSPKAGVFKCVAISLANGPLEIKYLMEKRCQGSGKMREDIWSDEDSWGLDFPRRYYRPVINVMLIGRDGVFSYRLGVGWILFRRWIDAERVFETILLK